MTAPSIPPDPLAEAAAALQSGRPLQARDLLEQAATEAAERDDRPTAAIALAFAADLYRMAGDSEPAHQRATRATELASGSGDRRALAAAFTALGEADLDRSRPADAAMAFARAAAFEDEPFRLARILRRRGVALWVAGARRSAGWSLGRAAELYESIGDTATAESVRLERVTALSGTELAAAARTELAARAADRPDIALSLRLLTAADLVDGGRLEPAGQALQAAKDDALGSRNPLAYIAAVLGLAVLAEESGADIVAYGQLASGWVTLGDLLGPDVGAAVFRTPLQDLLDRWGPDRFGAAKAGYEDERRAHA